MGQVPTLERALSFFKSLIGARKENPLFTVSKQYKEISQFYNLTLNVLQFALETVHERVKNPTDSVDMLNSFLDLHKACPDKFRLSEVLAASYINV
jgi:hypothetical protein